MARAVQAVPSGLVVEASLRAGRGWAGPSQAGSLIFPAAESSAQGRRHALLPLNLMWIPDFISLELWEATPTCSIDTKGYV